MYAVCDRQALVRNEELTGEERMLVELAWEMSEKAYCPYSNFPVGAAVLATNDYGDIRMFGGCNVENASYGGTICAERTAVTKAVTEGFREILVVALVCAKKPGGSPCGLCRQVIREFGKNAMILNVSDFDSSVVRWTMDELLPDSFGPDSL